jgi:parallel beta-helix repeat protein
MKRSIIVKTKLAARFLILLAINIIGTAKLFASNYYFSSSIGNDAYTAMQARNPATPWQTTSKLNAVMSTLLPGDSVLFKCGDTFYGGFSISVSGTVGLPITFSSYGTGAKPIITGLSNLPTWTAQGGNIWEANCTSCGNVMNVLTMNNVQQEMGRYPNKSAANKGFLKFESHIENTQITDNELSNTPNWTNGELVIRKEHWILDRTPIINHTGTTINFNNVSSYKPKDNWGYFIQNHPATLDQNGEWYFNPTTKKILVYSNVSPATLNANCATADVLIVISGTRSYINLNNLVLKAANGHLVYFNASNASFIKISNCDLSLAGMDGIVATSLNNCVIENNTINYTSNNGINISEGNYNVIKNNIILNIGTIAGSEYGTNGGYNNGIALGGNNNTITNNYIDSTGYNGITFQGDSVLIKNNFINNFCLVKDDGGGIYTWNNCPTDPKPPFFGVPHYNQKVLGNIVLNGIGNAYGTANEFGIPDTTLVNTHGIYLDDYTTNAVINDNTVANCISSGIFLHNAVNNDIKNNTLFNNDYAQLFFSNGSACAANTVENNKAFNNILFSKTRKQFVASMLTYSANNLIGSFGLFDSNYYCRPFDKEHIIYAHLFNSSYPNINTMSLAEWKTTYAKDPVSSIAPFTIPAYTINNFIGTNLFSNERFTTNVSGTTWDPYVPGDDCYTLWDNNNVLDCGSLKHYLDSKTNVFGKAVLRIFTGSVSASKKYILRFSLKGIKDNQEIGVDFQGHVQYCTISKTRTENEFLLEPKLTQANPEIYIYTDPNDSTIWIDNVQLYEANVTITNPDDHIRFEYNATSSPKIVPLSSSYIDVKNNNYSSSVTLQPYTSVILLKQPTALPTTPVFTSVANSNWNNPATWSGGVLPTSTAACIVKHNVTVTANASCKSITVEQPNGKVVVNTCVNVTVVQ